MKKHKKTLTEEEIENLRVELAGLRELFVDAQETITELLLSLPLRGQS